MLIEGVPENQQCLDSEYSMLELVFEDQRDILPARALLDSFRETNPVKYMNLSGNLVKLKKGYLIVELHPVESVQCPTNSTDEIPTQETTVPKHLEELFRKSCTNISEYEQKNKLGILLNKHQDAFARKKTDLGTCSVIKQKINTNFAAPVWQPLRRTPQGFESEEEQYLKYQLNNGVIQPSCSARASPVVLVRKKDNTVRWCIDYRKLNNVTRKDAYPLPRIDTCLDCLSSAKIFSTLDLQSGYWQLEVSEEDRPKNIIHNQIWPF